MASPRNPARPISPHLTAWKWGVHMTVSILHRVTGDGLATVGTILLVWWLAALAGGKETYAAFTDIFTYADGRLNIVGYVFGIGLTLSLFQHIATGIRHFIMDAGAGFELKTNRAGSWFTFVASIGLTAAFWAYILGCK